MKAEIIAIGTELLMGQIVNTNAQYLSQQFADIGVNVYYQTVVGDNAGRIAEAIRTAAGRADLIVFTGGLGPTMDDITKDVLAEHLGVKLYVHEPSRERIVSLFRERGAHMVESNIRQALMLEGADALMNDTGLAVGAAVSADGRHYVVLPGPPRELKAMFADYARPWIIGKLPDSSRLFSRMLKFAGIGESSLEDALIDLISSQTDPTIAPYAKEGEVALRLTTRADNEREALARLDRTGDAIKQKVGQYLYAEEDIGLEHALVALMADKGLTLAVAESCTGGLLSGSITSVPGSSAVLVGGLVAYSNAWKQRHLHIPEQLLEGPDAPGAVSEETARLMAEQIMEQNGADYGVSVTGVAGPAHSERKPVGLVYIAVASRGGQTETVRLNLRGNRAMIRTRAVRSALYHVWKLVRRT